MAKSQLNKIVWSDKFLLGNTTGLSHEQRFDVRRLDAHHKQLVRIIADLYDTMQPGQYSAEKIRKVMDNLTQFVITHLTFEEGIMAYYGYEAMGPHKAEHDRIGDRVNELVEDARNGAMVYVVLYQYLENWLLSHIATSDRKFVNNLVKSNSQESDPLQGLDPQLLADIEKANSR